MKPVLAFVLAVFGFVTLASIIGRTVIETESKKLICKGERKRSLRRDGNSGICDRDSDFETAFAMGILADAVFAWVLPMPAT